MIKLAGLFLQMCLGLKLFKRLFTYIYCCGRPKVSLRIKGKRVGTLKTLKGIRQTQQICENLKWKRAEENETRVSTKPKFMLYLKVADAYVKCTPAFGNHVKKGRKT